MRRSHIGSIWAARPCSRSSPDQDQPAILRGASRGPTGGQGDIREYQASLERLRKISPRLWLPAEPIEGQNATLYDNAWLQMLQDNLGVVQIALSRTRRP